MEEEIKKPEKEVEESAQIDTVKTSISGHILIKDAESGEVLVNKRA